MKYILIKTYPGSPKLNTIINFGDIDCDFTHNPKNYPEFWEIVVEKDYEILSLINIQIPSKPVIITKKENNLFSIIDTPGIKTLEFYDKYDYIKIHSVKRLSDGEIFTIDDDVIFELGKGKCHYKHFRSGKCAIDIATKIVSFVIQEDMLTVQIDYNKLCYSLDAPEKVKKVLFTTEDGVDIFEGDYYYPVDKLYYFLHEKQTNNHCTNNDKFWIFSTKEKAEEYILMNKPCLSLNDIEFAIFKTNNAEEKRNKLKDLVKSKIKQSV